MPLSLGKPDSILIFSSLVSGVIVDVDGERENVFARGPRWVPLSSKEVCQRAITRSDISTLGVEGGSPLMLGCVVSPMQVC